MQLSGTCFLVSKPVIPENWNHDKIWKREVFLFFPFQIRCSTFYIVVAQLLHTTNYIHVTLLKSKIRKRICLIHQFDALFLKNPQMQSITMFASCMQFRLSLILLIFKSLQSQNIWGIRHTIYFYSFTIEAL